MSVSLFCDNPYSPLFQGTSHFLGYSRRTKGAFGTRFFASCQKWFFHAEEETGFFPSCVKNTFASGFLP